MDSLDSRFLREFLVVNQEGSIRRAAERLNIVPSAISRKITDAEIRLGVKLFKRHSQGVQLTEAGEVLLHHAINIHDEQEIVLDLLGSYRSGMQRVVRIAAGEGFSADLMQNGLKDMLSIHPELKYEVLMAGSDDLLRRVQQGESDIAVAYNPIIASGTRSLAIGRQPLCAIVPQDSPLLKIEKPSFEDALKLPHALLTKEHGVRQLIARAASDLQLSIDPVLETDSITMLIRFVSAGMGITFLPRFSATIQEKRGELHIVELAETPLQSASAHLIVRARSRLPKSVDIAATYLATRMVAFTG